MCARTQHKPINFISKHLRIKEVGMRGRDEVKGGGVWGISHPREIEEVLKALDETETLTDVE